MVKRGSNLPLLTLMTTIINRYSGLPPSDRFPANLPFRTSKKYSQAGISGELRRQSVPFLWCCVMGMSDIELDNDPIVKVALQLEVVN